MQVRDCYVHDLSSAHDLFGEAWEGAETIACSAWRAEVDFGLLHHSIYIKKKGWQWNSVSPALKWIPKNFSHLHRLSKWPHSPPLHSFQDSATTCSNVPGKGCMRALRLLPLALLPHVCSLFHKHFSPGYEAWVCLFPMYHQQRI